MHGSGRCACGAGSSSSLISSRISATMHSASISLATMEAARIWFLALWRNPVAETLLLGALLAHWLLGLWLIYRRRTLRMPAWEATQIIFGLAVPPLLAYHVLRHAGGQRHVRNRRPLYPHRTELTGCSIPWAGIRQLALFTARGSTAASDCTSGCASGVGTRELFPVLLSAVVLVPVLALLGVTRRDAKCRACARSRLRQTARRRGARAFGGTARHARAGARDGIRDPGVGAARPHARGARRARTKSRGAARPSRSATSMAATCACPSAGRCSKRAARRVFRMHRCAAAAGAARLAASGRRRSGAAAQRPPRLNGACSIASVRRPRCASPANCGRTATSR